MPRDRRGAQLSVELPPELLQRLKAAAAATDRPVAALVRRWIEAGLAGGLEGGAVSPEPAGLLERVVALEAAVAALGREQRPPAAADPLAAQLAAMGAAVAGAGRARLSSPKRVSAIPQTGDAPIPQTGEQGEQAAAPQGALTTAELAHRTGTNRAGWNNWAAKAAPGDVRHHRGAGSWRLVGKAPAPGGGPDRWLWQHTA